MMPTGNFERVNAYVLYRNMYEHVKFGGIGDSENRSGCELKMFSR
jgi:hypothetical protein